MAEMGCKLCYIYFVYRHFVFYKYDKPKYREKLFHVNRDATYLFYCYYSKKETVASMEIRECCINQQLFAVINVLNHNE